MTIRKALELFSFLEIKKIGLVVETLENGLLAVHVSEDLSLEYDKLLRGQAVSVKGVSYSALSRFQILGMHRRFMDVDGIICLSLGPELEKVVAEHYPTEKIICIPARDVENKKNR